MKIGERNVDWRALVALSVCRLLYGGDGDVHYASRKFNAGSPPSRLLIYSTNRDAWKLGEALQIMMDREEDREGSDEKRG